MSGANKLHKQPYPEAALFALCKYLVGNNSGKINSKFIAFYKTFGGLGLLISKAQPGAHVAIAKDGSSSIPKPHLKFPSSKSNCTGLILITFMNI